MICVRLVGPLSPVVIGPACSGCLKVDGLLVVVLFLFVHPVMKSLYCSRRDAVMVSGQSPVRTRLSSRWQVLFTEACFSSAAQHFDTQFPVAGDPPTVFSRQTPD